MTELIAGQGATLAGQFLVDGVLTDPGEPVTLTIEPTLGGGPILMTTDVVHASTGIYTYVWTPPEVTEATDYLARWDGTGIEDVPWLDVLTVLPAMYATWASPAEVLAVTGIERTESVVALASSMIETYSGAIPDMPDVAISTKDRHHLMRATSWQAAWLTPTRIANLLTERETARSVSADAVRIERDAPADIMLAPMAARELKNLSWIGTRSIARMPRSSLAQAWDRLNFLNEQSDLPIMGGPL